MHQSKRPSMIWKIQQILQDGILQAALRPVKEEKLPTIQTVRVCVWMCVGVLVCGCVWVCGRVWACGCVGVWVCGRVWVCGSVGVGLRVRGSGSAGCGWGWADRVGWGGVGGMTQQQKNRRLHRTDPEPQALRFVPKGRLLIAILGHSHRIPVTHRSLTRVAQERGIPEYELSGATSLYGICSVFGLGRFAHLFQLKMSRLPSKCQHKTN